MSLYQVVLRTGAVRYARADSVESAYQIARRAFGRSPVSAHSIGQHCAELGAVGYDDACNKAEYKAPPSAPYMSSRSVARIRANRPEALAMLASIGM